MHPQSSPATPFQSVTTTERRGLSVGTVSTAVNYRNGLRGSSLLLGLSRRSQLSVFQTEKNDLVHTTCNLAKESQPESARRHVIVTGANTGIGKATAMELAMQGMVVTLACRNEERGKAAAREICQATNNPSVRSMTLDLGSLRSVQRFAAEYKESRLPLHVLVNNAGIMACPQAYTDDGFERQFAVNHLGHFLLTSLLLDNLVASASAKQKSRVVVLSSSAERIGDIDFTDLNYKGSESTIIGWHMDNQNLQIVFSAYELAKRCRQLGLPVISNSVHPGIVNTKLIRYVFPAGMPTDGSPSGLRKFVLKVLGLRTAEEGASTAIFLASSPIVENSSGFYYVDCKENTPSARATDAQLAACLWDASIDLTGAFSLNHSLGLGKKAVALP